MFQDRAEVSIREVVAFQGLMKHPGKWYNASEWAKLTGVTRWGICQQLARFAQMGLVEKRAIYPTTFYRFNEEDARKSGIFPLFEEALNLLKEREAQ